MNTELQELQKNLEESIINGQYKYGRDLMEYVYANWKYQNLSFHDVYSMIYGLMIRYQLRFAPEWED